jgi:ADP-heptose:LPS heptosyltransferase
MGWREYEWRFQQKAASAVTQHASLQWRGECLKGKVLLLLSEQGMGDTILAIRYAQYLKAQGARLIVECQKPLLPLFDACKYIDELHLSGLALPPADYHLPLMSLPGVLGEDLSFETATPVPYLQATPERVNEWQQRLDEVSGFRVGIVWQGNPGFKSDLNRSFPLQQFAPLAALDGVSLLSLQKGQEGVEQIAAFKTSYNLVDVDETLDRERDFMDTAAIMMNLDLVVTSCTSVANLAGALGVPTWVVLGENADWRWLLDREDSPWYPSVRLFRQQKQGSWDEVFARVAAKLPL